MTGFVWFFSAVILASRSFPLSLASYPICGSLTSKSWTSATSLQTSAKMVHCLHHIHTHQISSDLFSVFPWTAFRYYIYFSVCPSLDPFMTQSSSGGPSTGHKVKLVWKSVVFYKQSATGTEGFSKICFLHICHSVTHTHTFTDLHLLD